eukprot:gnl/TRDRNA2_/TRDRNA2_81613_c0_seq1.p1 gnl/TRDRNA2_/TRDRNA2_81613_c0~~gnl/TRDRNA2_/TRDRNA2_81613_c0_seq1.p1  ORF type:complete len:861 (+),score=115.20 gnl/TRDRNA2_/TRDRNA2_81613_c0_seq1:93-2675(+)
MYAMGQSGRTRQQLAGGGHSGYPLQMHQVPRVVGRPTPAASYTPHAWSAGAGVQAPRPAVSYQPPTQPAPRSGARQAPIGTPGMTHREPRTPSVDFRSQQVQYAGAPPATPTVEPRSPNVQYRSAGQPQQTPTSPSMQYRALTGTQEFNQPTPAQSPPPMSPAVQYRGLSQVAQPTQTPTSPAVQFRSLAQTPASPAVNYRGLSQASTSPAVQYRNMGQAASGVDYRSPRAPYRAAGQATPTVEHRSPRTQYRTLASHSPQQGGAVPCSPGMRTRALQPTWTHPAGARIVGVREMPSPAQRARRIAPPMSPAVNSARTPSVAQAQARQVFYTPQSQRRPLKVEEPPLEPRDKNISGPILEDCDLPITLLMGIQAPEASPQPAQNTLREFLQGVASNKVLPALCSSDVRIDPQRYHLKRSAQNQLRRLLEFLQDALAPSQSANLAPSKPPNPSELGSIAFHKLASAQSGLQVGQALTSISEEVFINGLDSLGMDANHDAEVLGMADRKEVFCALLASSVACVKRLQRGHPLPTELTRHMLCDGLMRVPFNLPDFPVQPHLIEKSRPMPDKLQVAEMVANVFAVEHTGMELVKDWFLSGLLSLEEIQAALPRILPQSLVEDAVMRIIRAGLTKFTDHEWEALVLCPRNPEGCSSIPEDCKEGDKQAGKQVDKEIDEVVSESPNMPSLTPSGPHELPSLGLKSWQAPPAGPGDAGAGAMTSEAPVLVDWSSASRPMEQSTEACSAIPASSSGHVCDWSMSARTAVDSSAHCSDPGHQADEGAGTPQRSHRDPRLDTSVVSQEQPYSMNQSAGVNFMDRSCLSAEDLAAWVSMEFHNECRGPFLALAFERCCQLYQEHYTTAMP